MSEGLLTDVSDGQVYSGWRRSLGDGLIRITRCHRCRRWQWYPLAACPACGGQTWEWDDVGTSGVVHSWTRVVRPTVARPGLEPPYVLALVELPQADGARLVALSAVTDEDPRIGEEARLEVRRAGAEPVLFFHQPPSARGASG
ncbi:Zn-ribbon domain-containing OB-fold protein [Geodermatophilus sp. CPCC 205506]|uniref:Zn-ribbon domain-containing OB-fold protein n=1 Tax=Geodermatophilus sp. CPCC 205506 TaxID=2936596 RepID=UPI003F534B11